MNKISSKDIISIADYRGTIVRLETDGIAISLKTMTRGDCKRTALEQIVLKIQFN